MKKFSEFDKQNTKIEESKSKKDFIKNLIEESLTTQDGVIIGKDVLVESINSIIEMNEHKTTISVLENIKAKTYNGGLNFTWLNETIELEKGKIENIILEKSKKKEDLDVNESTDIESDMFLNESFMDIMMNIGMGIGGATTATFAGSVAWLIGSGVYNLLIKDTKLGEKGKEFADKIKSILSKAKKGGDDKELAKEFDSTTDEYKQVIDDMKSGKLGKDGEKFAKQLESAKQSATKIIEPKEDKTEKVEEKVEESLISNKYSDDSTLEMTNLSSIYSKILTENKKN